MEQTRIRCTAEEYLDLPEGEPYQLIGGKLTMTPAPGWRHQRISRRIEMRLATYVEEHDLGEVFDAPTDVLLNEQNVVQPDLLFISKGREGLLSERGVIDGAPDMVIEILSPSTSTVDTLEKREVYERSGVREYWIVDAEGRTVFAYALKNSRYELIYKASRGERIPSSVVKGFELFVDEVFDFE